jgi:hypothetical protein
MRILVAGAALAIAAAAYAQTGDHNDGRNKHEHSGGASQGSGYGASSYGQSGGYGQSSGYGYGQGSSGYGQSYGQSSGTGPHDADHGDRSAQSGGAGGGGDRWTAGDWVVDGRWERNDNHYSLTATAPPDELHGPDLFLRCRDGHFDLSLIGDSDPPHYRGLYSMMVMTDRSAPGVVLRVTRGDPEWIGESTVLATSAEYPLSNATQIYVRLRYERGGTRDYTYNFKDLQSGKQQLYNVCKPPPASQPWDSIADRGGRGGRDGYDGDDRRDGRDGHGGRDWHHHPNWPVIPMNPPRYRDLTQERDIHDQHEKALGGRGDPH